MLGSPEVPRSHRGCSAVRLGSPSSSRRPQAWRAISYSRARLRKRRIRVATTNTAPGLVPNYCSASHNTQAENRANTELLLCTPPQTPAASTEDGREGYCLPFCLRQQNCSYIKKYLKTLPFDR